MATLLGEAKIRLRPDTKGFQSEAQSGVSRAMGAIGGAVKKTFQAAGVAAGGLFATSLKKGWDRLTAIEDAQAKLKGLGHEAGSVQQIMDDALASVKGTAFGLGDAATIAASTVAAGIKPGQDLERTLKLVADAATIGGASMQEMGSIFNKVAAGGVIQGEELAQLGDRGIPILQLLAEELGVTAQEVKKLASEGKIDFETFQDAMEAGMGGAALKSAETTRGAIANFGAALGRAGAGLMDSIFPHIKGFFQGAIEWADNATPALEKFGDKAGKALAGAIEKAPAIWDKIKSAFETLRPVWDSLRGTAQNFLQIADDLGPTLGLVLGGGLTVVVEGLKIAAPLIESITGWLVKNKEIVLVAAGAWVAYGLATKAWTAYGVIATGVQKAMTFAQQGLNAALKANPIGIVVTALAALAAAAVYAWNNSETFREVVTNAWEKIQEAAKFAWENVLKPTFEALKVGWDAVVTGMKWAWENILKPTWDLIAAVVTTLWNTVLMPIFGLIGSVFMATLEGMGWAWSNILKPVFDAVWSVVSFLWNSVLSPIFGAIGSAWSGLVDGMKWVWEKILSPVFTAFGGAVDWIKGVFDGAVKGIGDAWNGIKKAIASPIQTVIDVVWNNGIRAAWNWINDFWEDTPTSGDIQPFTLGWAAENLATGGILPGYTPGRDVHKFFSPTGGILNLSGGEAVMRPEFTKALGPEGVNALNSAARSGGSSAVAQLMQGMHDSEASMSFADGGVIPYPSWLRAIAPDWLDNWADTVNGNTGLNTVVDIIKGSANKAWDFMKEKYDEFAQSVTMDTNVFIDTNEYGLVDSDGKQKLQIFGGGRFPGNGWEGIWQVVKAAFPLARQNSTFRNTPDRHGMGKAIDLGQVGRAGGIGHPYLAAMNRFLHDNYKDDLYELIYDGAGDDRPDLKRGKPLTYSAATQAQHRNHVHAAVYDEGGVLKPGFTVAHNASGRPEAVLNAEQLEWLRKSAANEGPLVDTIQIYPQSDNAKDVVDELMFELRKVKRGARV